jgi:hypothetical protein
MNEQKETPIISSFVGFVKKGTCPVCGLALSPGFGAPSSWMLCPSCGEYSIVSGKNLKQVDTALIFQSHVFAAPIPWTDMRSPTFPMISFTHSVDDYVKDTLTDMVMVKKDGVRFFDAKWPKCCCVCGEQATREESIAQRFNFTPPGKIRVREHEATVIAKGVPHCALHKNGAIFDRAAFGTDAHETTVGLLFRSYAYQIQFRQLNPWKWR